MVLCFLILLLVVRRNLGANGRDSPLSLGTDVGHARRDAPVVDLSAVPPRFIVFDLETTGLDPAEDEIIEIGAIRVNRDSDVHETFEALVKPRKNIPPKITRINGISQEMVDHEGEPLETVLKDFMEFIGDLPLVSFNAEFDMAFLHKSTSAHDIVVSNQVACALKMARRAWPGRNSYRLVDLAYDGGLSGDDMHRALGDCKRTMLVYTGAASKLGTSR